MHPSLALALGKPNPLSGFAKAGAIGGLYAVTGFALVACVATPEPWSEIFAFGSCAAFGAATGLIFGHPWIGAVVGLVGIPLVLYVWASPSTPPPAQ